MKRIFCIWLLMLSSLGQAAQVSSLYSSVVQMPASLDDQQLLDRAFYQAIDDVLVRVSGQASSLSDTILREAHAAAASWVAQHSVKDVLAGEEAAKEVNVTFYKESVDRFLFAQGLPVWGNDRPSILVWMIDDSSGSRQMLGTNRPSRDLSAFFDQAKHYGLPVYAPLVDEVDRRALSGSALWGFFEDDILNASQRYQTDVVLALRMSEHRGEAVAEALLLSSNQASRRLSVTGSSKGEAINDMLMRLSAILSDRYASIKMSAPSDLHVKVDGVHDYRAMASLRKYLTSIGVVQQIQLTSIVDGQVGFNVVLNGTADKFRNSVALSSMLQPKPEVAMAPSLAPVVEYQFIGKGNNE